MSRPQRPALDRAPWLRGPFARAVLRAGALWVLALAVLLSGPLQEARAQEGPNPAKIAAPEPPIAREPAAPERAAAQEAAGTPEEAAGTPEEAAGTPEEAAGTPEEAAGTPEEAAGTPEEAAGTPEEATPLQVTPGWSAARTAHYLVEHRPAQKKVATWLSEQLDADHARIYGELGLPAQQMPTRIVLLADEREMLAEAARRHGNRRPPEWAEGLAYPASREIFLHAALPNAALWRTTQHEISHIALGTLVGPGRVPTWFSEAIAIQQSEPFAAERAWLLTKAAMFGNLLPLNELSRAFPEGSARAGVAYAQAVHFIGYLQQTYGDEALGQLLRSLREDGQLSFNVAFERSYGHTLGEIEAGWRDSLKLWWGWLPLAFGLVFVWIFGLWVVIRGWRWRKGVQRQRLEKMRDREAQEWVGEIEVSPRRRIAPRREEPDGALGDGPLPLKPPVSPKYLEAWPPEDDDRPTMH